MKLKCQSDLKNSGRVADENDYDSVIKSVDLKASIIFDLLYIN